MPMRGNRIASSNGRFDVPSAKCYNTGVMNWFTLCLFCLKVLIGVLILALAVAAVASVICCQWDFSHTFISLANIAAEGVVGSPFMFFGGLAFGIWLRKTGRARRIGKTLIVQAWLMLIIPVCLILCFIVCMAIRDAIIPPASRADGDLSGLLIIPIAILPLGLQALLMAPTVAAGIVIAIAGKKEKTAID